jgi:hypothetical protein
MCPPALRPGVVILLAMLAAPGTSVLRNVYVINRGYEDLAERLNALGATIETFRDISRLGSRLGAPPSLTAMARATPFTHIAIVQSRVISACTDQVARSRSRPRHHPRHRDATRHQDPLGHRHRAGHHASDRYLPEARPPLVAVIQHLHHRFEGAGFLAQDANVGRRDWNCTVHP